MFHAVAVIVPFVQEVDGSGEEIRFAYEAVAAARNDVAHISHLKANINDFSGVGVESAMTAVMGLFVSAGVAIDPNTDATIVLTSHEEIDGVARIRPCANDHRRRRR